MLLVSCGDDAGPVGFGETRYWDIAWSSPNTVLTDIEMLSDKVGWACGYRMNPSAETYDALIYRYDGKNWTVSLFLPGEQGTKLMAIDFAGANNGWAVGSFPMAVVLHYDGKTWTAVPSETLNGRNPKLLAVVGENDVWVSDGFAAFHYDGMSWTEFPITAAGAVDDWLFPNANVGWAIDYDNGYCYKWDAGAMMWTLESVPLYNATAFYFKGDGSGYYADYVNIPPVTERANIYKRSPGASPAYERVYATGRRMVFTACDYFAPDYYFFAGPNASLQINAGNVKTLRNVPAGELGFLKRISIAKVGDVWGIMVQNNQTGPSFIVHKKN